MDCDPSPVGGGREDYTRRHDRERPRLDNFGVCDSIVQTARRDGMRQRQFVDHRSGSRTHRSGDHDLQTRGRQMPALPSLTSTTEALSAGIVAPQSRVDSDMLLGRA
jgi:hypothetical protein